jgi:hypothetical protein
MNPDLFNAYIEDAAKFYWECVRRLLVDPSDLLALRLACSRGEVPPRGDVVTESGRHIEYRVHGAGYTFHEPSHGNTASFDVVLRDKTCWMRFSHLAIEQYASGLGAHVTREDVQQVLAARAAHDPGLIHVVDGLFNYFLFAGHNRFGAEGLSSELR